LPGTRMSKRIMNICLVPPMAPRHRRLMHTSVTETVYFM
jgi:hypothetical protein